MHLIRQVFMNNITFAGFILLIFWSVCHFDPGDMNFIFCFQPVGFPAQLRTTLVRYSTPEELVSCPHTFISGIC